MWGDSLYGAVLLLAAMTAGAVAVGMGKLSPKITTLLGDMNHYSQAEQYGRRMYGPGGQQANVIINPAYLHSEDSSTLRTEDESTLSTQAHDESTLSTQVHDESQYETQDGTVASPSHMETQPATLDELDHCFEPHSPAGGRLLTTSTQMSQGSNDEVLLVTETPSPQSPGSPSASTSFYAHRGITQCVRTLPRPRAPGPVAVQKEIKKRH
jgi:hypothetical protein